MTDSATPATRGANDECFVTIEVFARLFDVLIDNGYSIVGPTMDQGAIVYAHLSSIDDLPRGWTDEQGPGVYQLHRRDDDALFGHVVGPHSWKQFLFPPTTTLSVADLAENEWRFSDPQEEPVKYAFLGVRACELAAMRVQDRVFLPGPYVDPVYQQRRNEALIIAVNCTQAASTCFCTSMGTGPQCGSGFDLALTELPDGFVVEIGSPEGRKIINAIHQGQAPEPASIAQLQSARIAQQQAEQQIERHLDTNNLPELLLSNLEHPRWDDVASRCLSCTNCTMVCPTCFCSSVEEVNDLRDQGEHIERRRVWDSCFNPDFSYMNGGLVRNDVRSRYRQWLTHKLATWVNQFGSSGCVGCGRCITWCPVGIDLIEEVNALRESAAPLDQQPKVKKPQAEKPELPKGASPPQEGPS